MNVRLSSLVPITAMLWMACGGGEEADTPPPSRPAQPAAAPSEPPPAPEPTPAVTQPAAAPVRRQPAPPAPRDDLPFNTDYTGTVDPGMSESQVTAIWGPAVAARDDGQFRYLYFRNGCEFSCGMYDLVVLQDGQVADAVVRFAGHVYSGVSSSPPGRVPAFTAPSPRPSS